jgi:hypothetical protein
LLRFPIAQLPEGRQTPIIMDQATRLTPQSAPLEGTASAATAIARVSYTHDAMIDLLIANPGIKQGEVAKHFGYTEAWVSRIVNSDAFRARMAARKADLVDPALVSTIDEKLSALASSSLNILLEKLEVTKSADLAVKVLEPTIKALGYGARQQNVAVQQNFVVPLPPVAVSAAEWAVQHSPRPPGLAQMVEDAKVVKDAE